MTFRERLRIHWYLALRWFHQWQGRRERRAAERQAIRRLLWFNGMKTLDMARTLPESDVEVAARIPRTPFCGTDVSRRPAS